MQGLTAVDSPKRRRQLFTDTRKSVQFGIFGGAGGVLGSVLGDLVQYRSSLLLDSILRVGMWFGIIRACIAVALLAAHAFYLKRGLQLGGAIKNGALFGFLAGAIAGSVAQFVYHGIGASEVLRVICWGLAG